MWIVKFIGTDSGVAEIEEEAHGGCDEWAGGERQLRARSETRQCPRVNRAGGLMAAIGVSLEMQSNISFCRYGDGGARRFGGFKDVGDHETPGVG